MGETKRTPEGVGGRSMEEMEHRRLELLNDAILETRSGETPSQLSPAVRRYATEKGVPMGTAAAEVDAAVDSDQAKDQEFFSGRVGEVRRMHNQIVDEGLKAARGKIEEI